MKKTPSPKPAQWYVSAFNAGYLKRYPHRSDSSALAELPFVIAALKLPPRPVVLDLCCGAGRHARGLAADVKNARVVALDLSAELLRGAARKNRTRRRLCFIRGDKRFLPLASERFDGVMNLFTSFGYFKTDREHLRVLREVARVLKPRGRFVMDFLNLAQMLGNLVPRSERQAGPLTIVETRRFDAKSKRVIKTIQIFHRGPHKKKQPEPEVLTESIRAYSPAELRSLLTRAGLKVLAVYGDLCGSKFDEKKSPRCVLVCEQRG